MAFTRVKLNHSGMREVLTRAETEAALLAVAERVADAARASAPVGETGNYRDSISAFIEQHPTRVVAHVTADVPYAMQVESATGNLARAMDAV